MALILQGLTLILQDLTEEDAELLEDLEGEFGRAGGFRRVFPTVRERGVREMVREAAWRRREIGRGGGAKERARERRNEGGGEGREGGRFRCAVCTHRLTAADGAADGRQAPSRDSPA